MRQAGPFQWGVSLPRILPPDTTRGPILSVTASAAARSIGEMWPAVKAPIQDAWRQLPREPGRCMKGGNQGVRSVQNGISGETGGVFSLRKPGVERFASAAVIIPRPSWGGRREPVSRSA